MKTPKNYREPWWPTLTGFGAIVTLIMGAIVDTEIIMYRSLFFWLMLTLILATAAGIVKAIHNLK